MDEPDDPPDIRVYVMISTSVIVIVHLENLENLEDRPDQRQKEGRKRKKNHCTPHHTTPFRYHATPLLPQMAMSKYPPHSPKVQRGE